MEHIGNARLRAVRKAFLRLAIWRNKLYILSKFASLEIFMSTSKTIASTEIQNNFGLILNDVIQNSTRYIVKRHNQPQAILLSLADFERLLANQKSKAKWLKL